ncbi:MAG: Uma2 family endonuclease, partial [Chloroflexi bacterium]|nr:Uma2 family endonuclease [Chloroflexota bacterium]
MAITQRRLTLEEFLELPEESPALELIDGVVSQKVAPQWVHGHFQAAIAAIINQIAGPRKLARAFTEIREAHGRDSLVPDVGVYRWDRIPRSPTGRLVNAPPIPPDIAAIIPVWPCAPVPSSTTQINRRLA